MKPTGDELSMPLKIAAAGLAGCTADLATFPFDTIKVWLQVRGEKAGKSVGIPTSIKPKLQGEFAFTQPIQTRAAHLSASTITDPSNAGTRALKLELLSGARGAATVNFTEMTASEMYMLKKRAMAPTQAPTALIDNAVGTAIKLKANATQTFNELTVSELYMAHKRAALAAARTSKKATTGAIDTIVKNIKKHGARSLYSGLNAGLQRQIGFCSVRIGFYDNIKDFYTNLLPGAPDSKMIGQRILAGATAGFLAVCLFQPTEVVKIRMQAERGRYKGTFQAYRSIFKTGGLAEAWKGVDANCARTGVVNVCELVTYDVVKESILKRNLMRDNVPCHFVSALTAGLVTTIVANPIDVVKTRFMNSEKGAYKNPLQCAAVTLKSEGMTAFYKGFFPSYVRIGLWNLVMFMSFEQYKKFFKSFS